MSIIHLEFKGGSTLEQAYHIQLKSVVDVIRAGAGKLDADTILGYKRDLMELIAELEKGLFQKAYPRTAQKYPYVRDPLAKRPTEWLTNHWTIDQDGNRVKLTFEEWEKLHENKNGPDYSETRRMIRAMLK